MSMLSLIDQVPLALVSVVGAIVDPGVNTTAIPGAGSVAGLVGGIKYLALMACLASLFIGGGAWGISTYAGNGSIWGRRFAMGGAIGAIIVGLGADIVNGFSTL